MSDSRERTCVHMCAASVPTQDWGCMLQSMAESLEQGGHLAATAGSDGEAISAESIRNEAIEKLSHSVQFNSTTIIP